MKTVEELAEQKARKYRELAWWYYVGREDQGRADESESAHTGDSWGFATWAADKAREYALGQTYSLNSIYDLYMEYVQTNAS
jgi:hypothetical protein